MFSRQTVAALAVGLAVSFSAGYQVYGQATQPAAEVPTSEHTFVGVVTGNNVNVRFGPADSYYITMQLKKGDQVVAVGSRFDWLKIVPPKGSYSCIAKRLVDREEGSSSGTVNADETLVRAGSNVNQLKQPQMKLERGAKVTIIGEVDDFYKVVPPAGAYLYISKKFVEPLRAASADDLAAGRSAATRPAGEAAAPGDVAAAAGEAAAPGEVAPPREAAQPGETARGGEAGNIEPAAAGAEVAAEYDRLGASFDAMQKQPIEERSVGELRASYEALAARPELPEGMRRVAKNRVAILKVLEQQQAEVVAARKDAAAFRAKLAETENQRREIEQRIKTVGVAVYTAVGQLQNSAVQQGDQPLFRLVDPANGQTVVYIRTSDAGQIARLGQLVGVRGEVVSDQRLSVKVISPSVMEPVDAQRIGRGVTAVYMPQSFLKAQASDVQTPAPTTEPAK